MLHANFSDRQGHVLPAGTLAKAARISSRVAVYDVRLKEHYARCYDFDGDDLPPLVMHSCEHTGVRDDDGKQIRVDVLFTCAMAFENDESREDPPVLIKATFSLYYRINDLAEFDDDHIDAFASANGVYNAWPFWRELIHADFGRMGLPSLTIPVFSLKEERHDSQTQEPAKTD